MLAAGLPEPVLQHRVETGDTVYFIDIAVPGADIAVELDSRVKYEGNVNALYEEKVRQDALTRAGWTVVRVRTEELGQPQRVVNEIVSHMPARTYVRMTPRGWMRPRHPHP